MAFFVGMRKFEKLPEACSHLVKISSQTNAAIEVVPFVSAFFRHSEATPALRAQMTQATLNVSNHRELSNYLLILAEDHLGDDLAKSEEAALPSENILPESVEHLTGTVVRGSRFPRNAATVMAVVEKYYDHPNIVGHPKDLRRRLRMAFANASAFPLHFRSARRIARKLGLPEPKKTK